MTYLHRLCESGRSLLHCFGRNGALLWQNWRLLVPASCPLCASTTSGGSLCPQCYEWLIAHKRAVTPRCACCCLVLDGHQRCPDCYASKPAFDRIIAAFDYAEPADVLIRRLKIQRRFTDVPMLADLLATEVMWAWPDLPADLVVVPVPASRQAIRKRGFNPAAEVARMLARRLGRTYRPELLRRVREGHKQATLGRDARMMAAAGLYSVAGNVQGGRIAVVDDVLTTGSTMHSIARMLKRSGAASVHGLVLARTPHHLS